MSKHTPGPWEAVKVGHDRCVIRHALPGPEHVPGYLADVNNIGKSFPANVALIAAAPDLLAALIELRDWYVDFTRLPPVAANAAIAKATGGRP